MTEFLIGADPELFVRKNGELVSAYGLIPGTKDKPFKVNGGAVQVDGMALEFNIDPASTFKEFNDNIESVLSELKKLVGNDYEFDFSPVAEFGQAYIDAQPNAAKELGCDPDFSAYTGLANPKPSGDLGIRTASGHIHIGWTKDQDVANLDHIEACQMVSKQLDTTVGGMARVWDRDNVRRKMYGNWGAYRPKPYGVEYRTMSNVWVGDIRARELVFEVAMKSVSKLLEGVRFYESWNATHMDSEGWSTNDIFGEVTYQMNRFRVLTEGQLGKLRLMYEEAELKKYGSVKKPKVAKTNAYGYINVEVGVLAREMERMALNVAAMRNPQVIREPWQIRQRAAPAAPVAIFDDIDDEEF